MDKETAIAIVEDDDEISSLLADFLRREGFTVAVAESGETLDRLMGEGFRPNLIILDWMLPGEDGLSICRRLYAGGGPPIIMLTAKNEDIDRVLGLEIGADDYMAKPFNPRVLLARIRAVLRRSVPVTVPTDGCERLRVADLTVDVGMRKVTRTADGLELVLTSAEFDLLHCFVTRPQRVLSRDQLLDWTRGRGADAFDRTIDVQVSRLRRKLELHGSEAARCLKTVRNAGYVLAAPAEAL